MQGLMRNVPDPGELYSDEKVENIHISGWGKKQDEGKKKRLKLGNVLCIQILGK